MLWIHSVPFAVIFPCQPPIPSLNNLTQLRTNLESNIFSPKGAIQDECYESILSSLWSYFPASQPSHLSMIIYSFVNTWEQQFQYGAIIYSVDYLHHQSLIPLSTCPIFYDLTKLCTHLKRDRFSPIMVQHNLLTLSLMGCFQTYISKWSARE